MYQSPLQQRHRSVQTWDEMTVVVGSIEFPPHAAAALVSSSPRLIAPLCSSSCDCNDDSIPIIKAGRISPHTRHSIHPTVNRDNLLETVTVKLAVRTHLFGKKKFDSTFLFWSWSGYNQTVAGVPQFSFCYKSDVLGQWSTNTTASSSHPTPSSKTGHVPRASSETIFRCWGNEQTLVWRCILNLSHPAPEFIRNKLIISNNNDIVHYIIIISNATHLCPRCFICTASCLMSYKINARTEPGPEHRHQWKYSVALTVLFNNWRLRLCNTSSQ